MRDLKIPKKMRFCGCKIPRWVYFEMQARIWRHLHTFSQVTQYLLSVNCTAEQTNSKIVFLWKLEVLSLIAVLGLRFAPQTVALFFCWSNLSLYYFAWFYPHSSIRPCFENANIWICEILGFGLFVNFLSWPNEIVSGQYGEQKWNVLRGASILRENWTPSSP